MCTVVWLAAAPPVRAQDKPAAGGGAWSDAAEFSYVATAGNAQSTTLGFKNTLGRKWERSSFELKTGGVRASATTTTRTAVGPGPASVIVAEHGPTHVLENGTKHCRCHPVNPLNLSSTYSFPTPGDFFHDFPTGRQNSLAA